MNLLELPAEISSHRTDTLAEPKHAGMLNLSLQPPESPGKLSRLVIPPR